MKFDWPDRLLRRLWEPRPEAPWGYRLVQRVLQILFALVRDLAGGQLTLRAMGLVYVTILAIVPVIAIAFSVLKAFGFHRQLQPLIHTWLQPLGPQGAELTDRIIGFVDGVQGNLLAGLGLAMLFVTTLSMAQRVETSFNYIWRVDRPRNLGRRLTDYFSVLLVGPVVLVTALGLIASVESSTIFRLLTELGYLGGFLEISSTVAPYVLVGLTFAFVYWFIPNTRVAVGAALVGGLAGGSLWAAAGVLFTRFVLNSAQTLTIYATFAILIFALIWLYVCWLTLLVGAQIAFYVQYPGYLRLGYRRLDIGGRYLEQTALAVMAAVARAFRRGGPRPTPSTVSRQMGIPAVALNPVLRRLERGGLLVRSEKDELLPSRDPDLIPASRIVTAVRETLPSGILGDAAWPEATREALARATRAMEQELDQVSLAQLADSLPEMPARAPARSASRDGHLPDQD